MRPYTPSRDDSAEFHTIHAFLLDHDDGFVIDDVELSPHQSKMVVPTVSVNKEPMQTHGSRRPMINTSRLRMKHEIATRQQQVIALQERLEALRRGDNTTIDEMVVAWQTVAKDQQMQREHAEQVRNHLRALIQSNKYALAGLERGLCKMQCPQELVQYRIPMVSRPVINIDAGFAVIARQLERMYTQLDTFFSPMPFKRLIDSFQDVRVTSDLTPTLSIEFRDMRFVPFDVETTTQAMWLYRYGREALFAPHWEEVVHQSDTTIRRRFVMSFLRYNSTMG